MGLNNDIKIFAKQIVKKLDELDGKDNKIGADVWKKHAVADFGAKNNVSSYISIFSAEKSIELYLKRNSKNNNVKDLGQKWLDSLSEISTESIGAKQQEAPRPSAQKPRNLKLSGNSNIASYSDGYAKEKAVSTLIKKPVADTMVINSVGGNTRQALAEYLKNDMKAEISELIKQEIAKSNIDKSKIDIAYWSEKIAAVSTNYNIPYELLVSIISRETKFSKNVSGKNGHGAMQLTTIAVKSFFPTTSAGWDKIYEQMDSKLMNDILYVKGKNGQFKTDSKGNKILKYKNPTELLRACGKDDELSMKVGTLIFEMKYAEAVAAQRYGKGTFENIPKVIAQLHSGDLKLSKSQNTSCLGAAIRNYNGNSAKIMRNGKLIAVKDDYKREVMDSLKVNGYNFAEQIISKQA